MPPCRMQRRVRPWLALLCEYRVIASSHRLGEKEKGKGGTLVRVQAGTQRRAAARRCADGARAPQPQRTGRTSHSGGRSLCSPAMAAPDVASEVGASASA
mmetsp:Transcript_13763/g.43032  ORF Transcript_13763/g.43032 Transcript_13763/m.43032 type:complete len:100 (-) Transcript_13763:54-353(-)